MNRSFVRAMVVGLLLAMVQSGSATAEPRITEKVVLITIDGLRWQEVFSGADKRLINRDSGGVRDVDTIQQRFWAESPQTRRSQLMPFFWNVIARHGQVFGDVNANSIVRVTNGRYFSYPGYHEILCGFADEAIDSNAKRPNPNITVLEWFNQKPTFRDRVAAFGSWDVFPYILNQRRSGIYVNAGWQDLTVFNDEQEKRHLNRLANDLPRTWPGVRYDAITARGAIEYLKAKRPHILYVALGETDDWAHDGRYDLYLDAAYRSDRSIKQLWDVCQQLDDYRGKTTLILTTDHGRGDDRVGWKSHGASIPGAENIWVALIGPDTTSLGLRTDTSATQSQIAATVAGLFGEDFAATDARIAPPLPGTAGAMP